MLNDVWCASELGFLRTWHYRSCVIAVVIVVIVLIMIMIVIVDITMIMIVVSIIITHMHNRAIMWIDILVYHEMIIKRDKRKMELRFDFITMNNMCVLRTSKPAVQNLLPAYPLCPGTIGRAPYHSEIEL